MHDNNTPLFLLPGSADSIFERETRDVLEVIIFWDYCKQFPDCAGVYQSTCFFWIHLITQQQQQKKWITFHI